MKQYQVPQFINVEDRIIGPFTLKQFLYLLGAAGVAVVGLVLFNIFVFIILAAPIAVFFIALAFVKISNQPLPTIVSNAVAYYTRPRLYIWKHVEAKEKPGPQAEAAPTPSTGSTPSIGSRQASFAAAQDGSREQTPPPEGAMPESKLADLAWSLDVKENLARRYR